MNAVFLLCSCAYLAGAVEHYHGAEYVHPWALDLWNHGPPWLFLAWLGLFAKLRRDDGSRDDERRVLG